MEPDESAPLRHPPSPHKCDTIREVLDAAQPNTSGAKFFEYQPVTPSMAKGIVVKTSIDVRGYAFSIDQSAVRHAGRRHRPRGEADRSVDDADLAKLQELVRNPDAISVAAADPRKQGKLAAMEFRRRFRGEWIAVVEVRTGAKQLALVSMRKEKAAGT